MDSITELHPLLQQKVTAVINTMAARGVTCRVTQGLRTSQQQDDLYAQGRTKPGPKVTNARGGYSSHNFGLAVDLVPELIPGGVFDPDWHSGDDHYKGMQQAARDQGLICGIDWHSIPDPPHFQLAGAPVTPDDAMRALLIKGGLAAVWAVVKS